MSDWKASPFPRTCAYLESIGIDPNAVARDGVDASGYDLYQLNDNGIRVLGPNKEPVKTRQSWSSAEVAKKVLELMGIDEANQ